jgi:hypothetical protein
VAGAATRAGRLRERRPAIMSPMPDLELARNPDDRRRYDLHGVGSIRVGGLLSRGATATEAGGASWSFDRPSLWRRTIEASDAAGAVVGSFDPRTIRRGGALIWRGRDFELRPASAWKERYALADGERELAVLDGKGWGKRPVKVTIDDPNAVDPGLLLFAAYVVRRLAEDAATVASSGSSAAPTG